MKKINIQHSAFAVCVCVRLSAGIYPNSINLWSEPDFI